MNLWTWIARRQTRHAAADAVPDIDALFGDIFAARETRRGAGGPEIAPEFRALFLGSPRGKRVLYEILSWAGMFRPSFVPGDAYATHYRDGERNIGLRLLAMLVETHRYDAEEAETESPEKE
jgi:hypothetical protein